MGTTWDIDNGLHEMTASEDRAEAMHLVHKARRCGRKQRDQRNELMARAAQLFRDADELGVDVGEETELRKEVKAHIAAEPDSAVKQRMEEQARYRWGYNWENEN